MKKIASYVLTAALATIGFAIQVSTAQSGSPNRGAGPAVSHISRKVSMQMDGPGCSFHSPSENKKPHPRDLFRSNDLDGYAWVNIDKRDVRLRLLDSTEPPTQERVGSKSSRKYVNGNVTVQLNLTATRVCKVNDDTCSATDYSAMMTVTKGGHTRTVKAVGQCGS